MIRPWYRSRLFWLGIPAFLFLLWLWLALPLWVAYGMWRGSSRSVIVGDSTRTMYVSYADRGGKPVGGKPGFSLSRGPLLPEIPTPLFPQAIQLDVGDAPERSGFNLFIAYWFLALLYLAGWAGAIVWHQRRKVRLAKASAAPLP